MPATITGNQTGTVGLINAATAQNSTSGTSIDFTGIPAGVKRITVVFNGVSTNGTSAKIIRLGTSGGIATTGYQSGAFGGTNLGTYANSTTDFILSYTSNSTAAATMQGSFTISNLTASTWVLSGSYSEPSYGVGASCGGSVSLSGTLDRIRITTVNGTDTFDAGSINILYE